MKIKKIEWKFSERYGFKVNTWYAEWGAIDIEIKFDSVFASDPELPSKKCDVIVCVSFEIRGKSLSFCKTLFVFRPDQSDYEQRAQKMAEIYATEIYLELQSLVNHGQEKA